MAGTAMTSKQCKAAYKQRLKDNEPTWEDLKWQNEQLRLEDEKYKKGLKLEQIRKKRKDKADRSKAQQEALRRLPGPVKAKWAADEPKVRITDFFKSSTRSGTHTSPTKNLTASLKGHHSDESLVVID